MVLFFSGNSVSIRLNALVWLSSCSLQKYGREWLQRLPDLLECELCQISPQFTYTLDSEKLITITVQSWLRAQTSAPYNKRKLAQYISSWRLMERDHRRWPLPLHQKDSSSMAALSAVRRIFSLMLVIVTTTNINFDFFIYLRFMCAHENDVCETGLYVLQVHCALRLYTMSHTG